MSGKSSIRKREEKRKRRGEREGERGAEEKERWGGGARGKREKAIREKMGMKLFQYKESRGKQGRKERSREGIGKKKRKEKNKETRGNSFSTKKAGEMQGRKE